MAAAIVMGSPCRRIQDPVAFTCAVLAAVQAGQSDRPVSSESLKRAVPYSRSEPEALPPSFFRAVQRFRDHKRRLVAS